MNADIQVYDINESEGCALIEVTDEGLGPRYITLNLSKIPECHPNLLQQRHYVARATHSGLMVCVGPLLPGWRELGND